MRVAKLRSVCLLGICLVSVCPMFGGCGQSTSVVEPNATTGTVTIKIVGDTEPLVIDVAEVSGGTTLETVMRSIDQVPIKIDGSGTTAFVDQIGDTKTSSGKGWTFTIDGEFAEAGIGSTVLEPPTTITWEFSAGEF